MPKSTTELKKLWYNPPNWIKYFHTTICKYEKKSYIRKTKTIYRNGGGKGEMKWELTELRKEIGKKGKITWEMKTKSQGLQD